MTYFVGLDVSQKMTAICVVDNAGQRLWRGQSPRRRNRSPLRCADVQEMIPHWDRNWRDGAMARA
jgi:hypothetical protein